MSTYSYAQQQGFEAFDWLDFLREDNHTYDEWGAALIAADSWKTDPCATLSAAHARANNGRPLDQRLSEFSTEFYDAIRQWNIMEARHVYSKIQIRSSSLLSQMV
jgi:hypothetical protein